MEVITHRSRMAPCPRGADLKNDSCQKGERESTPIKKNQGKA